MVEFDPAWDPYLVQTPGAPCIIAEGVFNGVTFPQLFAFRVDWTICSDTAGMFEDAGSFHSHHNIRVCFVLGEQDDQNGKSHVTTVFACIERVLSVPNTNHATTVDGLGKEMCVHSIGKHYPQISSVISIRFTHCC